MFESGQGNRRSGIMGETERNALEVLTSWRFSPRRSMYVLLLRRWQTERYRYARTDDPMLFCWQIVAPARIVVAAAVDDHEIEAALCAPQPIRRNIGCFYFGRGVIFSLYHRRHVFHLSPMFACAHWKTNEEAL